MLRNGDALTFLLSGTAKIEPVGQPFTATRLCVGSEGIHLKHSCRRAARGGCEALFRCRVKSNAAVLRSKVVDCYKYQAHSTIKQSVLSFRTGPTASTPKQLTRSLIQEKETNVQAKVHSVCLHDQLRTAAFISKDNSMSSAEPHNKHTHTHTRTRDRPHQQRAITRRAPGNQQEQKPSTVVATRHNMSA